MLKQIVKLLKALNADVNPGQIAGAVALGLVLGFTPMMSLHNLLVLFLVCILRINISALLVSFTIFSGVAYLLDPVFVTVGEKLLLEEGLKDLWTSLYQQDIWRLAHFNHTLTLGSLVISLILLLPVFFLARILIIQYREKILAWVQKSRLMQFLKANKYYGSFSRLYNAAEGKL